MKELKKVLCIMGPTASGKSDLALEIAQKYAGEIINVDSAQVYRGMDIGTAKVDLKTRSIVPHHLFDIREPHETYSAADFYKDAEMVIDQIHTRGKLPILAGGSMLYFKALFDGLANLPPADESYRDYLENKAQNIGWPELHKELEKIDSESAARIKPNDKQRIQRALEVFHLTKKTLTHFYQEQSNRPKKYNFIKLALVPESRAQLHAKIEKRLKMMMENGFVAEVTKLKSDKNFKRDCAAMRAVGYRQVLAHLFDEDSMEEAINKSIYATRQLAKRQLTWLRGMDDLSIIDPYKEEINSTITKFYNTYFLKNL